MELALKGGGEIRKKPFFKWPVFDQCEENVPTESEKGPQEVIKKIISLIDNLVYSEALISGKLYAVGVAAATWAMLNLSKR